MNIVQRFWWYFGVTSPWGAVARAPRKFVPKKDKMAASCQRVHLTKIFIKQKSPFWKISSWFVKKILVKIQNLRSYGWKTDFWKFSNFELTPGKPLYPQIKSIFWNFLYCNLICNYIWSFLQIFIQFGHSCEQLWRKTF